MVCCVKANAYGHGMIPIANALAANTDALAVASIEEAVLLRESNIKTPILLLEGIFAEDELQLVSELDLWIVVHNQNQLGFLEHYLERYSGEKLIDAWLKIDTGMHRLGFDPEHVKTAYNRLGSLDHIGNIRLMTHFACADELDNPFTEIQLNSFDQISSQLGVECSLANSAGILGWPESHQDWVRPGYMLYGLSPFSPAKTGEQHVSVKELEPVMSFQTQVIDIKRVSAGEGIGYNHHWRAERDTDIAVLAVGYGDGYPRNTKNRAPVLIDGQRAKTVGHVAMDMMMVDISDLGPVTIGAEVELWGKDLSVNEVAAYSGYSPYELLTRIPPRLERKFIDQK